MVSGRGVHGCDACSWSFSHDIVDRERHFPRSWQARTRLHELVVRGQRANGVGVVDLHMTGVEAPPEFELAVSQPMW